MKSLVAVLAVVVPLVAGASNGSGKTTVRTCPGSLIPCVGFSGPLIADDPNTVSHVTWNGSALVDSKGNAWTMNGTVPQVAKSGKTPAGAGPFSDANYYARSGPASDNLDFTGDFSVCAVVTPTAADITTPFAIFVANGAVSQEGYFAQWFTGGTLSGVTSWSGNNGSAQTVTTTAAGRLSVVCFGRAGTTVYSKLNLGAIATATGTTITAGTTQQATLGRYLSATGRYMTGTLHEVWFSTTTPSDALFTAIMQRVKLRAQITAW
jgi:hypothetical protein